MYKWVTGAITPIRGGLTLLITGPLCIFFWGHGVPRPYLVFVVGTLLGIWWISHRCCMVLIIFVTTIPWFCQPFCTFLPTHVTRDIHRYVYVAKRHVFFDSVEPLQKSKFHRSLKMSVSHICNNFTDGILHYLHEENLNEWPVACSQLKPMQMLRNQHGLPDGIGWSFSLSLLLRRCRLFKNWCAWDWAWNSSTLVE